jgi:hypothetical protein
MKIGIYSFAENQTPKDLKKKIHDLKKEKRDALRHLKEELKKCYDLFTDEGHIKADKLLLEYINDKEVTELFNNLPKWYE